MGKRTRNRVQSNTQPGNRRNLTIALVTVLAIIVVAILIVPNLLNSTKGSWPNANGMQLGDPNAPVKVEDFSDFQCPFCGDYARNQQPEIIDKYIATGKVHYTFTPFSFLGPESVRAAEAAYCASAQNKFWQFSDMLYNNQAGENKGAFSDTNLILLAERAGLKMTEFRPCFDQAEYRKQVEDDYLAAQGRGVTGTPYFFVNGEGPVDMNGLDAAIAKALEGSN